MVLLKGEFDFVSNYKEENIRRELEGIFSWKFFGIIMYDFEFVKRDRNIIFIFVVKMGYQWDFVYVKYMCGNGCFYVRLVISVSRENIEQKDGILVIGSENVVSFLFYVIIFFVRLCNVFNLVFILGVLLVVCDEIDDENLLEFGVVILVLIID